MHIVCTPADLAKPLSRCAKITNPRSPHSMAHNLLLDVRKKGLYIHASDFDRSLIERVPVDVADYGRVCVTAETLANFVGLVPQDADLTLALLDNDKLSLEWNDNKSTIAVYNDQNFPKITPFDRTRAVHLDADVMERMTKLCDWCVPKDDVQTLMGIFMEAGSGTFRMTATNRSVFVHAEAPDSLPPEIEFSEIVHQKSVERIAPIAAAVRQNQGEDVLQMAMTGERFMLTSNDSYFAGPLVEGEYVPYEKLFPADDQVQRAFTCDRNELLAALRRARLFGSEVQWALVFSFSQNRLVIRGGSVEKGHSLENVPAKLEGDFRDVKIAFDPNYIIDGLRHLPTPEVRIELVNSLHENEIVDRAAIRADIQGVKWFYIVMSTSLPPGA